MNLLMHMLDLAGTGVFAVTGALAAGRKRMDVFGVVVLGCVTALGGGTLRDMILGVHPVFWISDKYYLAVATIAAVGTYLLARRRKLPSTALLYMDAVGLAVFTIIGFQKGFNLVHEYGIAIVLGVMTGVVGGIARDILSAEVPLILSREIYASASMCGASILALLSYLEVQPVFSVTTSLLATLGIRIAAVHWNLTLPIFRLGDDRENNVGGPKA
jgi:uncharacterized membrane protein YeiH